jgi:hypothetical protein
MTRAQRPLALDFRSARRGARWAAWLLAAAALGFSSELAVSYLRAREAIALSEQHLARLDRPAQAGGPARGARPAAPEEIAHARDTYLRLTTPWNELFGALESTASDKVVLLAIEPDPRAGTVVISGEGGDYPAVLEYVAGLQRAGILERVHLLRHEVRENERGRAAGFAVSASWSEVKR